MGPRFGQRRISVGLPLLCAGVAALMVRSCVVVDDVGWQGTSYGVELMMVSARLTVSTYHVLSDDGRLRRGFWSDNSAQGIARNKFVPAADGTKGGLAVGSSRNPTFAGSSISVPMWPILLLLVVPFLRAFLRVRAREGYCPACGYDLRASIERCPECGRAIHDAASANST